MRPGRPSASPALRGRARWGTGPGPRLRGPAARAVRRGPLLADLQPHRRVRRRRSAFHAGRPHGAAAHVPVLARLQGARQTARLGRRRAGASRRPGRTRRRAGRRAPTGRSAPPRRPRRPRRGRPRAAEPSAGRGGGAARAARRARRGRSRRRSGRGRPPGRSGSDRAHPWFSGLIWIELAGGGERLAYTRARAMQARLDGARRDRQRGRDLGLVQLLPRVQQQDVALLGGQRRRARRRVPGRPPRESARAATRSSEAGAAASTPVRA